MDDLSNAREEIESFLKGLQENDRIAIYVMRKGGFQILQDTSTDHPLMAATLAKWVPSAESLQIGQEQEERNRQQMDYVHNTEDLLSVNGNEALDTTPHTQALDPKLRELGDDPGRDALSTLLLVARQLAAMPGHKSLVWIASDNVLADWTNSGLNMQKGDRNIDPVALRVQEAMNDAHVSVYPLDVSRLEAGGVAADVAAMNVQLNPAASANQVGACGQVTPGSRAGAMAADPALTSGVDIDTCAKNLNPGRMKAQMQQDLHSIQGVYREIADATGGRAFRRASDIVGELNDVAEDDRATYLLSFSPSAAADDKYHLITVKLAGHKNAVLRYRTGYFYKQEPGTLKDRFRDAALEPGDATEIGLTASFLPASKGHTVKLGIAATDLAMAQKDSLWTDKLDIFLVQREIAGTKAKITGQCLNLRLAPGSYQKYLKDGIPFDQAVEAAQGTGSIRVVVVDENSGRMGSVTIPVSAFGKQS
jgi:VWFA-related protein